MHEVPGVRENRVYARQIHPLPTFGWICRRSLTGGSLSCNRRQHLSSHGILDPPPVTKTERRMDSRKKGVCCQTVTPSGYKSMISFSFHPLKRMEEEIICNRWKTLPVTATKKDVLLPQAMRKRGLRSKNAFFKEWRLLNIWFSTANNRVTNR